MSKPLLASVYTAASAAFRERSRPMNALKDLHTMPEGVALRAACKAALDGGCKETDVHAILKACMGPMAGDAHALMIPQTDAHLSDTTIGGQEDDAPQDGGPIPQAAMADAATRTVLKGDEEGMDGAVGSLPDPPEPADPAAGAEGGEPIMKAHVAAHTRNVHGKLVQVKDYDTANAHSESLMGRSGKLAAGRNNRHPFNTAHNATITAHSATNRAHMQDSPEGHIGAERLHRNAARLHTEAAKISGRDEAPEHQALAAEHHAMADHHGALAYGTPHETSAAGGNMPSQARHEQGKAKSKETAQKAHELAASTWHPASKKAAIASEKAAAASQGGDHRMAVEAHDRARIAHHEAANAYKKLAEKGDDPMYPAEAGMAMRMHEAHRSLASVHDKTMDLHDDLATEGVGNPAKPGGSHADHLSDIAKAKSAAAKDASDHSEAAQAHDDAAMAHEAAGNKKAAQEHWKASNKHRDKASA